MKNPVKSSAIKFYSKLQDVITQNEWDNMQTAQDLSDLMNKYGFTSKVVKSKKDLEQDFLFVVSPDDDIFETKEEVFGYAIEYDYDLNDDVFVIVTDYTPVF